MGKVKELDEISSPFSSSPLFWFERLRTSEISCHCRAQHMWAKKEQKQARALSRKHANSPEMDIESPFGHHILC